MASVTITLDDALVTRVYEESDAETLTEAAERALAVYAELENPDELLADVEVGTA